MKYNINVIKSVWRRLRKPSRATLDAIRSQSTTNIMTVRRQSPPKANYAMCQADAGAKRKAHTVDSEEWKRLTQTLHPAMWKHITQLEADRHDVLTAAKEVVHSRDTNVERRPSSVSIKILRDMIARVEWGKS